MRLDADQLEWVVREVVRRLLAHLAATGGNGQSATSTPAATPTADAHITLSETLITTSTLEHRLDGVTQVTVSARAIITPAVRDLLKERNIELNRV